MKSAITHGDGLPEIFSQESWQDFLSRQDSTNQELVYRDPLQAGWALVATLRGEGKDSPELFHVYERDGRFTAIPGEFVTTCVCDATGATSADQYEVGDAKGLQARHAKKWAAAIALVHNFSRSASAHLKVKKLQALLIAKQFSDIVLYDLNRLKAESATPENQALVAKEAGAAYESGLKNLLVSIGLREKKGSKRKSPTAIALPWEWITVLRAQQFVTHHKALPRQVWLIKQVQSDGVHYKDEKGRAVSKWREFFRKVGLDTLPP